MADERSGRPGADKLEAAPEDTLRSFLRELYGRKMASTIVAAWGIALIYVAVAVWSAVRFFGAADTRSQIMWAAIFLACFMAIGLIKVFAIMMVHRQSVRREIRRLEAKVAELAASPDQQKR